MKRTYQQSMKRERGTQTPSASTFADKTTQTESRAKGSYFRDEDTVITYWKLKSEILQSKESTIDFCQGHGLIKSNFICMKCQGR